MPAVCQLLLLLLQRCLCLPQFLQCLVDFIISLSPLSFFLCQECLLGIQLGPLLLQFPLLFQERLPACRDLIQGCLPLLFRQLLGEDRLLLGIQCPQAFPDLRKSAVNLHIPVFQLRSRICQLLLAFFQRIHPVHRLGNTVLIFFPSIRQLLLSVRQLRPGVVHLLPAICQILLMGGQRILCVCQLLLPVCQLLSGIRELCLCVCNIRFSLGELILRLCLHLGVAKGTAFLCNGLQPILHPIHHRIIGVCVARFCSSTFHRHGDLGISLHGKCLRPQHKKPVQRPVADGSCSPLQRQVQRRCTNPHHCHLIPGNPILQ